jgi:hypothetical protein
MKRSSTASHFARVFLAAAAIAAGAAGCGSDNGGGSGGGGSGGAGSGGAGSGGAGSGAAGSGGGGAGGSMAACSLDDVNKLFASSTTNIAGCTVIGQCHDNQGAAAGLDLTSAGWQTKLIGKSPTANKGGDPSLYSQCADMGRTYLVAGSNPATGLLIDKIDPNHILAPCGMHMPSLGGPLSQAKFNCIRSYLTTLTSVAH